MPNLKTSAHAAPQSLDDLTAYVAELGATERKLARVRDQFNTRVELARRTAATKAEPLQTRRDELIRGIDSYVESHRDELTQGGKTKTVKLPSGEIQWRMTPPKVTLRKVQEILDYFKERKLNRFIRVKEEVDKTALLKEPEVARAIPGISIGQVEELIVKPLDLEIEVIAGKRRRP